METKPQREHQWLQKLVGEWESEADCNMGPDKPPGKMKGTESVRSIGGLWIHAEGKSEMPGGGSGTMFLTIGYDPAKKRYVGTWFGSMMSTLWVYDGLLDASGNVLTLSTEGPVMGCETTGSEAGKTARYRDVIEFRTDDHRTLTSSMQGEDGTWIQFMQAHYRRLK
jgi:hypothetical protein